eukprot:TRINITY_DN13110_c0_g2_i1.p1 TRINITY_DN13110_c0_g2~~TRINITY_DN13110_c0_g2_i1.p1  ORF type:complete len:284 (+),score=48.66 TRINITY_DN13110_c0_g2_i1:51-902(+)
MAIHSVSGTPLLVHTGIWNLAEGVLPKRPSRRSSQRLSELSEVVASQSSKATCLAAARQHDAGRVLGLSLTCASFALAASRRTAGTQTRGTFGCRQDCRTRRAAKPSEAEMQYVYERMENLRSMRARDLKRELDALGVNTRGCADKESLVEVVESQGEYAILNYVEQATGKGDSASDSERAAAAAAAHRQKAAEEAAREAAREERERERVEQAAAREAAADSVYQDERPFGAERLNPTPDSVQDTVDRLDQMYKDRRTKNREKRARWVTKWRGYGATKSRRRF